MNIPIVSVIMSVYNGEIFLREAVDSVLNQTFTNFEFIIVDDGSMDGTRQILSAYAAQDPRIAFIRNEKNLGVTRSLNKALALARGNYIARQDADDISLPQRLEKQVAFLDTHPFHSMVGTWNQRINATGEVIFEQKLPSSDYSICTILIRKNQFIHGSVVASRSFLQLVGGYRGYFEASQDYDLWLRLAEISLVGNFPQFLYQHRYHNLTITAQRLNQQSKFANAAHSLALERLRYGRDKLGYQPPLSTLVPVGEYAWARWRVCETFVTGGYLKRWLRILWAVCQPAPVNLRERLNLVKTQMLLDFKKSLQKSKRILLPRLREG